MKYQIKFVNYGSIRFLCPPLDNYGIPALTKIELEHVLFVKHLNNSLSFVVSKQGIHYSAFGMPDINLSYINLSPKNIYYLSLNISARPVS